MSCLTGQVISEDFTTQNPTTGALANATGTPAGTLIVNGVNNAAVVSVANKGTGRYTASVTLPTLVPGDRVQLFVSATVSGVAGGAHVWEDYADIGLANANGVEPGVSVQGALRAIAAMVAGVLAGANASTGTVKPIGGGVKDRVTITTDADGNRLTVVLDLSDQ